MKYIINLADVNASNIDIVGGKNASIGEMIQHLSDQPINVPGGFATTIEAYKEFLSHEHLGAKIEALMKSLKINNLSSLNHISHQIRRLMIATPFSKAFEIEIAKALSTLKSTSFAIRSSATAEDLPEASFAGQQETFLNIHGLKNILQAIKLVFASLFTSRAISYRHHHGFNYQLFAMSVGIQPMIRSDKGSSGVMFTLDTESGFDKVILINASYGLGEAIVQGCVNPDEFYVYKNALVSNQFAILQRKLGEKSVKFIYTKDKNPKKSIKAIAVSEADRLRFCLDDEDVHTLAKTALLIEKHYQKPMDIEWAKDGLTGKLYILQARPETVKSKDNNLAIKHYHLNEKGKILSEGVSIGQHIGSGHARIILDPKKMNQFKPNEVIVTDMTDPDWEPIMKNASAIVTNRGGRTCHAAIIARELGIPAVVGCGDATSTIKQKEMLTVSCAEGQKGYIYAGKLSYHINEVAINKMPKLPIKMCLNLGNPEKAFLTQRLPNDGVGLARLEFIISSIGIHPKAILNYKKLPKKIQRAIDLKTRAYDDPVTFYTEKLSEGISMIAAAFYPKEVIFRFSDFKSNEYANLLGGDLYEIPEENPMIGFRGASRYRDERFRDCFELECMAFNFVREKMGLTNAHVMIPFVRTVDELKEVIHIMSDNGLVRGKNNLKIYMMCEIPSNVILADEFLKYVDGFSIGSNDLTQLVLGLDRDSSIVASLFNERDQAVKSLIQYVVKKCRQANKYIGICGQAPSDHPDFAAWLLDVGITSMSLNSDSILETWIALAKKIEPITR